MLTVWKIFSFWLLVDIDIIRTTEAVRTDSNAEFGIEEHVQNESFAVHPFFNSSELKSERINGSASTSKDFVLSKRAGQEDKESRHKKRRHEKYLAYLSPKPVNRKKRKEAMSGTGYALHPEEPPNCKSCDAIIRTDEFLEEASQPAFLLIAFVIWGVFLLWFLGSIATDFFVPSLLYWSQYLGLRPEIAGATLVAFGNGAPDLFAAGAAAEAHDVPLALGELLGSNIVHLTITTGSVVACGFMYAEVNNTETMRRVLTFERFRETFVAYLIAVGILSTTIYDGHVSVSEAMVFPLIYVIYLAILFTKGAEGDLGHPIQQIGKEKMQSTEAIPLVGLYRPQEGSWTCVPLWILSWPFHAAQWITIPQIDKHWDRSRRITASLCPLGMLGLAYISGWLVSLGKDFHIYMTLAAISAFLGGFIFLMTGDGPELPIIYPFIACLAVLSGAFWLDTIAQELTGLVETLGLWANVAPMRLGFTVIAWGNCVGDVLSCVALARCGQVRAAFGAAIASPLLDILMGYGTTLYIVAANAGGTFALKGEEGWPAGVTNLLIAAISIIAVALMVLAYMLLNRVPGSTPVMLFGVYGLYTSLMLVVR